MELIKKICLTSGFIIILLSFLITQSFTQFPILASDVSFTVASILIFIYMLLRTIQNKAYNNPAWLFYAKIISIFLAVVNLVNTIFFR